MKVLIIFVIVIICFCVVWIYLQPVSIQTYRLAPMKTSWVAVEYDRKDCPTLTEGWFGRELEIPSEGYLCTSSPMETGWTYDLFYLEQEPSVRLNDEINITLRGFTSVRLEKCQVQAEVFLVRLNEFDKPSNTRTSFLEIYRPECNTGVTTESK